LRQLGVHAARSVDSLKENVMIPKRVFPRFAIAAAVVGVAASFTAPIATADNLSNGLDVTCNAVGDNQLTCVIGGCPRVNGDYVVDAVHVMDNGHQDEYPFKCINGQTATHNIGVIIASIGNAGYTLGFQGCRKNTIEKDWCGPWADYTYKPPAAPAAAPPPAAGPTPGPAPAAAPPVQCPDGSTVPAGQNCPVEPPPTNAVTMTFQKQGFNEVATFTNSSKVSGQCHYDAEDVNGILPGKTDDFSIGANGKVTRTYPAPPPFSTYNATVTCHGNFNGQDVQFGNTSQPVSG
jgi:hypothetical protein